MSDERHTERTARFAVNADGEVDIPPQVEPPAEERTEIVAWPQSARRQETQVTGDIQPDDATLTEVARAAVPWPDATSEAVTRTDVPPDDGQQTKLLPPYSDEATRLVAPDGEPTRVVPPAGPAWHAGPETSQGWQYGQGGQYGEAPSAPPAVQWYGAPPRGPRPAPRRRVSHWLPLAAALLLAMLVAGIGTGYVIWGTGDQGGAQGAVAEQPATGNGNQVPYEDQAPYDNGSGAQGGGEQYLNPYNEPDTDGATDGATTDAGPSAEDVAAIAAKVSPGIVNVNITLAYDGGEGAGTGIVLTSTGEVLTNYHVVQGAGRITVTSVDGGGTYNAVVKGYDRTRDIALLQLEGASGLPTVQLGDSSSVTVGDKIVVIGNAGGDGGEPTSVGGAVTALNRDIVANGAGGAEQLNGLIEVGADVQSGHSGGATVNDAGEVIGVTTAASMGYAFGPQGGQTAGGTGYAVPIADALAVVEQVRAGDSSSTVHVGATGFLGVQVSGSASGYGYRTGGAMVAGVLPDTPAEDVGLQAGDVITAVDNTAISSASELTGILGSHKPGDEVKLAWVDQYGDTHAATVTLMEGPPPA